MNSLSVEEQRHERHHLEVPMNEFGDAIEQGDWTGQNEFLREMATRCRTLVDSFEEVDLHYFGLAEVPHIVALGAHIGSERMVILHDYDRDTGLWRWPSEDLKVEISSTGEDELTSIIRARGPAVIRVSISAEISDQDIREVVGDATVADITIGHRSMAMSTVGRVCSAADVNAIRQKFRGVLASVQNSRPHLESIHLFVAAPPSVCFAIGQELTLRNSVPIQLYRYRKSHDRSSQQAALYLTTLGEENVLIPLAKDEIATATWIRDEVWTAALKDLASYIANKKEDGEADGPWFRGLRPREVEDACPFPALPSLRKIFPGTATVDNKPFNGEYGFDKTKGCWRLGDRLLLGFHRAADANKERLQQLVRLFLIHETLHTHHSIMMHTSAEVGKFANCLEYLDYTADAYSILHQLDLSRYQDSGLLDPDRARTFLAEQVDLAIKGFWAFDTELENEWQVRRIRRYLNWYWRLVQIEHGSDLQSAIRVISRQPHLEIGGLYQVARGRRIVALLDREDASTHLELGIVLENDRLCRISDSPNTNLPALLKAFSQGEHESIKRFFRAVYETVEGIGGAQPGT